MKLSPIAQGNQRVPLRQFSPVCPRLHSASQQILRSRRLQTSAKSGDADFNSLLSKYGGGSSVPAQSSHSPKPPAKSGAQPHHEGGLNSSQLLYCSAGVAALLAVNAGVYGMAAWGGKAATVASMVLPAAGAKWWQYISSAFVHATAAHLARDLGIIWLAGSTIRNELSSLGVWFTYVFCAVGANLSAMWLMPAKAKAAGGLLGLAATGGTAGLAIAALALGFRPSFGFLLAASLFGNLSLGPLLTVPVPGGPAAALPVNHALWGNLVGGGWRGVKAALQGATADPGLTWLWGAAAAALAVVVMARLPDPGA